MFGEITSWGVIHIFPRSGALEVITHKISVGFDRIRLDLFFLLVDFGIKVKVSFLGILTAVSFAVIGRML